VLTLPQTGELLTISGPWCGVYTAQWQFPEGICKSFWRNLSSLA